MSTNVAQNPNTTNTGPGERGEVGNTGTGAPAGGGGVGGKLKSAYHVIHGMGDNVRGTALGAIDTATHKGGTENDEIARRGRVEMEQGLAAFRQPKPGEGGQAGGATGTETGAGPTTGGASTQTGNLGQNNAPQNSGAGAAVPENVGPSGFTEGQNGKHGPQDLTADVPKQSTPGSQAHFGENGNHDERSGSNGTRVDPQNKNHGPGGYDQPEKRTTEEFASRATSVPNQGGASRAGGNGTGPQGQNVVEEEKTDGTPAYHHRDDAVTDLNARPGEKHGEGQLSTASGGRIPDYDRNEAFETQPGRDVQGNDRRQEELGQGRQGPPADAPNPQGGQNEDYSGQFER